MASQPLRQDGWLPAVAEGCWLAGQLGQPAIHDAQHASASHTPAFSSCQEVFRLKLAAVRRQRWPRADITAG